MPNDFYTPDRVAFLRDQIQQANATGLPWMADNAQRAWQYAVDNGAQLPFDAQGNDVGGSSGLPPLPAQTVQNDAAVQDAIGAAQQQGVYQPPAPEAPIVAPAGASPVPDAVPAPTTSTPNVPPSLMSDPAYAAFVNALGLQRSTAERNTQDQVDAVNRGVSLRLPQIADAGNVARERVSGSYETRGLLRSGQHEQALARQRQGEAAQTAGVQEDAANRAAALRQSLAGQETGFDTQLATQALQAGQRQQDQANARDLQQQQTTAQAAQLAEQRREADQTDATMRTLYGQYGYTVPPRSTSGGVAPGTVGIVPGPPSPESLLASGSSSTAAPAPTVPHSLSDDEVRNIALQLGIGV